MKYLRNFFKWIFIYIPIIVIGKIVMDLVRERQERERKIKRKLKYFEPTISEGFLGKKVNWKLRNKPLSEGELETLF